MWNKAYLLAKKEQYPEAEKCIEKTFELLLSIIGEDNVDIAKTYHFQSKVRIFAHDAQGAIESLDNAKLIYEKLNFSTFASMTEKDIARLKAGEFWEPDILLRSDDASFCRYPVPVPLRFHDALLLLFCSGEKSTL